MSKITLTNLVNLQNETTAVNAINANNAVLTAALDNTLSRDGTQPNPMSANLDMNSNRILNLAAPASSNEPVRLQDLANAVAGPVTLSNLPTGGTAGQVLTKNSSSNYDASWATPSGGGGGGGGGSRILLTSPLTVYVSPTGSDTTGTGTIGNPWKTRNKAYQTFQNAYDLGGQTLTIQLLDGVHTDSFQTYGPQLVGQNGPGGIVFNGNATTPANVIIRPAANTGYAYGCAFGASITIKNQAIDMINSAADAITVGQRSAIQLGDHGGLTSVNDPYGIVFLSPGGNGFNSISSGFGGFIAIQTNIRLQPSTYTTTGTWSNGGQTITLASTSGIVPSQFMGIEGAGIGPANSILSGASANYITSVSGNVATLAYPAGAAGTNVLVQLTAGGQAFMDLGGQTSVYWATNGDPNYSVYVELNGYPFYSAGFFFGQGNCYNNAQAITFVRGGQGRGPSFAVKGVSVLDTDFQGTPYVPGNPGLLYSATWSAGATTINLGATGPVVGNTINSYASFTSTFGVGASAITPVAPTVDSPLVGYVLNGPGIVQGTRITSIGGGQYTLSHPTYSSQTSANIVATPYNTLGPVTNGTWITAVNGTTVTLSQPAISSGTSSHLLVQPNLVLTGSQFI
jgi:hypothetical protein